jgi:hypothetical protein
MRFFKKAILLVTIIFFAHTVFAFSNLRGGLPGSYRSMNFEVYAPSKKKAKIVCLKSEKYYKELLRKLRYGGILDKKCRIYVYDNHADYYSSLHAAGIKIPKWSGGCHLPRRYFDYGYPVVCGFVSDSFLKVVLPHELTHAIFAEFVYGTRIEEQRLNSLPLWIDEGMAVYMQEESDYKKRCKKALKDNEFISLQKLISFKKYPADEIELAYFYAQSPSLTEFLISAYGGSKFLSLSKKSVFDDEPMDELIEKVYYGKINSLQELENDWVAYIKETY